jgi:hypothetical protein
MIENMTIRKFAPGTQEGYIRAIQSFSAFLGASPDTARFEDLRRYQLHLVSSGAGVPTINHTLTALRFLFMVTLRKPDVVVHLGSGANELTADASLWGSVPYRAASTAFQIAGAVLSLRRSLPRLNCPLWIRRSSSMPATVTAAVLIHLKPSIGAMRNFTPR